MKRVMIDELHRHVGEEVEIAGWLYNERSSGKILFLVVRDGSGFVQAVCAKGEVDEATFEAAERLTQESSLLLHGRVREDRRAPGGVELTVTGLRQVGESREYPISLKEHGDAFLLDHRHLWLRSKKQWATLRIRHEVISAIRDFLNGRGFICFDTPIFTPNAVEGTTTLFSTRYFETSAFLAQSGQLYAEAGAMALGKVYTFGPTFRAEKSKTRRHLTEFWMMEPEVAYLDLEGDMQLAEEMIAYIVGRCLENRSGELEILERDTAPLEAVAPPFPRIHYDAACDTLEEYARAHPDEAEARFRRGDDFGGRHETILAEAYRNPVMITHFPAAIKAFYMKRDAEMPDRVLGFDMIAPEGYGEIIGGSEREADHDTLLKRIEEHGLPREAFQWYLDLRKYGTVPHSGFGLGLERTVAWIAGRRHLRECIPFPRMIYRMHP